MGERPLFLLVILLVLFLPATVGIGMGKRPGARKDSDYIVETTQWPSVW